MSEVEVEILIDRPPEVVWNAVEDVASHVEWMQDAAEIRFLSDQRKGVGTSFECDTVVGPLKVTDVMEITEWETRRVMGVRHVGYVTGVGRFELIPSGDAHTIFRWTETLEFPWFFGGAIGARFGRPVLAAIWRANLKRLKQIVESRSAS